MGLKTGQTNNPNGRPKGSKNRVSEELRERITAFVSDEFERILKEYQRLPLPERMRFFERLMGYALPKLQSVEYTIPEPQSYVSDSAGPLTEKQLAVVNAYCKQFNESHSNTN